MATDIAGKSIWNRLVEQRVGLAIIGLIVAQLGILVAMWGILHTIHAMRREFDTRSALMVSAPWAYAETPDGVRVVAASQGVTLDQLGFLARYRGRLLDANVRPSKLQPGELKARLAAAIQEGFARDPANLLNGATPRQALAAFAMLRTRGSIPTYEVRSGIPDDIDQLVLGTRGSCSDYTVRLMMVLESLGFKSTMITSKSTHLDGHVFVDALDPQEDTAYLLDANFSVMIVRPHAGGRTFMESHLKMSAAERERYAQTAQIHAFPEYFRFADPGDGGLTGTPVTAGAINEHMADREPNWRRWLAQDAEQVVGFWEHAPNHCPHTLRELKGIYLSAIPKEFAGSGSYARHVRDAAGLKIQVPGSED